MPHLFSGMAHRAESHAVARADGAASPLGLSGSMDDGSVLLANTFRVWDADRFGQRGREQLAKLAPYRLRHYRGEWADRMPRRRTP